MTTIADRLLALPDRLVELEPSLAAERNGIAVVRAPGRVNLMGDHTDHNEGYVLPAAIDLEIRIAFVPTDDGRVVLTLDESGETATFDVADPGPPRGEWVDYVAATAWALRDRGIATRGFRGVLASSLPAGAGLSSSAAIELAAAWALAPSTVALIEPMSLARTAQRAENDYVGVQCGIMDQFAVTMGRAGSALFLDCRSLAWHPVPIPEDLELVVCHSGSPRKLEASAYNARRAECARAAAAIAERVDGVVSLRDVDTALLERHREALDDVAYARALHVVTENTRVLETEAALAAGDRAALGALFADSHASLRDRFEVSSGPLDALVEIATHTPGVIASRLTGAGFGGCTINLVERGRSGELQRHVERDYPGHTGLLARVFVVEPAVGAGLVGGRR